MFNRILIVCVGNICRSPMGEGLLNKALLDVGVGNKMVMSAGIQAMVGYSADAQAQLIMKEHGLDITDHRARQLDIGIINWAELILVMEMDQKNTIESDYPSARGKIFRMGEWDEVDIPDPYQQSREIFELTYGLISKGVSDWVTKFGEGASNE